MDINEVIKAWKKASTDLQISVEAPFIIHTYSGEVEFPMLVKHFGSEKGTIILDFNNYLDDSPIPEEL